MAHDQVSFYDEILKKQIEGSFKSDGRSINIYSVYGAASFPYNDLGACIDHKAQVSLVQKLLSEMARDPSARLKELQQPRDGQQSQRFESFSMWASGVGTNP